MNIENYDILQNTNFICMIKIITKMFEFY